MKLKTYGIPGLLEWHGTLSAGDIRMRVSFTNGTVTGYGVAPASFTTKDEMTQYVIEHSNKYKAGQIILVRESEVPDDEKTKARKARAATPVVVTPEAAEEDGRMISDRTQPDSSQDDMEESAEEAEQDADGVVKVTVADKTEAVEWLKERYPDKGYTVRGLRAKADFDAACRACGVEFVY